MYAALTYFGYGKLICKSSSPIDNGKIVNVSDGKKTWSGVMTDGMCVFNALPCKNKYTVSLINAGTVEYSTNVVIGFGDCQEIDVGLDKTTWKGLKAIVNAGLENEMLTVGDQISAVIDGETQVFDIVHINYRTTTYGHNVVIAKHTCLPTAMQMRTSSTNNSGGYSVTELAQYLDTNYYDSLPEDMKSVITQIRFQVSVGGKNYSLQNEEHKVWIPMEYNVHGANANSAYTENTPENVEQFAYFATPANKVKTLGDTGATVYWWTCSPCVAALEAYCTISSTGAGYYNSVSGAHGVLPCFLIAADTQN